jgi:hypothetical protein
MKSARLHLAFALSAITAPCFAQNAADGSLVGRVETFYVRQSANFFIEKRLVRRAPNNEQWTEVRFAGPLTDGRTSEIVRVPDTAVVEQGDLVSTQLADKRDFVPGLVPEVNRMVSVVAKHDTLAAMIFGLPKPAISAATPYVQTLQSLQPSR